MAPSVVKKPKRRLKEVKVLADQLLSSRAHLNNLPILLSFISPESPPECVLESLLSVHSFFASVLPDLPSSRDADSDSSDAQLIYATWVRSKFDQFVRLLIDLSVSEEADVALKEVVLDTLMEFLKLGNGGRFNSAIYHRLIAALVHSTTPTDFIVDLLRSKYFKYIDFRYFTYISLEKLARNLETTDISDVKTKSANGPDDIDPRSSIELSIHKMHDIISSIPPLEGKTENFEYELWSDLGFSSKMDESKDLPKPLKNKNESFQTKNVKNTNVLSAASVAKKMKLKFTKAWISFLRLPLPVDVYKEVLVALHQTVIPHLSNPLILCDFLTRSYDIGGVVSVMALSSLFILMTNHGLEYPNFYEKLYALLLPSIFMAKHRARFFQLLDTCLKSPLLPAYLAAAFAKKLSRLALVVPPSGALVIIALIHNLLRRHPSINCLVHREDGNPNANDSSEAERVNGESTNESGTGTDISATKPGVDNFNNEERNPAKAHALGSSLWEINDLRHHYCPPVSRFVLSLENDLTVRAKTTEVPIEDFSSGSYGTIFAEEMRRRVKSLHFAAYSRTPTSLFSDVDFAGWTFKNEEKEKNGESGLLNISERKEQPVTKRQRVES